MALDLHRVCQNTLRQERMRLQVNIACLLESFQSVLLANVLQMLQNFQSYFSVLAKMLEFTLDLLLGCDFHHFLFVWNDNGNAENFGGLSMEENFINILAFVVNLLNFFCGNVLSLLQLENVLLSVNDLEPPSFRKQHSHISGLEPAVLCQCLFCLFSILIVPQEHSAASEPNLSSGSWSAFLVFVCAQVLHFWNVCQLELKGALNPLNKKLQLVHRHVL